MLAFNLMIHVIGGVFSTHAQDIISGDGFTVLNTYMENLQAVKDDYCIFGGIYEAWEGLWRMPGISNALMDMAREPEKVKTFCHSIVDFAIENMHEQAKLSDCKFFYIWGDLGYKTGLLFSPRMWREIFFTPQTPGRSHPPGGMFVCLPFLWSQPGCHNRGSDRSWNR